MSNELEINREKIDKIDRAVIELLAERKRITENLIKGKKKCNLPVEDLIRENEIVTRLQVIAKDKLAPEFVLSLYQTIFKNAKAEFLKVHSDSNPVYEDIKRHGILIAGPCAIESKEQIEAIAAELSSLGIKYLRGGAYKPRTSPDSFQGMGAAGISYLVGAAKAHGMYSVSEITAIYQLEKGFDSVDILQIGSRNAMNFELLKAVGNYSAESQKPVILKRGFSMTVKEFLSAADYIRNSGNPSVILCLRGIRTFEQIDSEFRFTPDLATIQELKDKTDMPVIFDPSHSAGTAKFVLPLAKAAISLGADGLIVEAQVKPECALSDARQCLKPEDIGLLKEMMIKHNLILEKI